MRNKFLLGAALSLAACVALAADNKMHYGAPAVAHAAASNNSGAAYAPALQIRNYTYNFYTVTTEQADGSADRMTIDPVSNPPYNIISINHPYWPVHVTIESNYFPYVIYDQFVYSDRPTVDIYPSMAMSPNAANSKAVNVNAH